MNILRAFVIVTAVSGMTIVGILIPQAVYAQAALTAEQEAAIAAAVRATINEVNAQNCATPVGQEAAIDEINAQNCATAMAAAIANVTQAMVNAYGGAAAGAIASIVIATSTNAGVLAAIIGVGLGTAAAMIEQADTQAAQDIARAVVNQGSAAMAQSFSTAALSSGGSLNLFAIAASTPQGLQIEFIETDVDGGAPCVTPSCS